MKITVAGYDNSVLKMEGLCYSETSVKIYQTSQDKFTGDINLPSKFSV
jgi:hypothetical protein